MCRFGRFGLFYLFNMAILLTIHYLKDYPKYKLPAKLLIEVQKVLQPHVLYSYTRNQN